MCLDANAVMMTVMSVAIKMKGLLGFDIRKVRGCSIHASQLV